MLLAEPAGQQGRGWRGTYVSKQGGMRHDIQGGRANGLPCLPACPREKPSAENLETDSFAVRDATLRPAQLTCRQRSVGSTAAALGGAQAPPVNAETPFVHDEDHRQKYQACHHDADVQSCSQQYSGQHSVMNSHAR